MIVRWQMQQLARHAMVRTPPSEGGGAPCSGRQTRPALFALLHLHSSLPRNQLLLDDLLK